jgi:serine/threonine-protein kinase
MHEALTGSAASHDGEPLHRVMQRVCEEGIPPVRQVAPGVPPHVAALVDRALRRDPSERFPSARAMHEALGMLLPSGTRIPAAALAGGAGIVVAPPASALPVVPTLRASYVVGGIASALLVVALALLGRAAVRDPGPASAPTFAKIPEDPPPPAALPVPVAPADDPPREVAPSAPSPARPRGPRTAPPAGARPAAKATDPLDHM